MGVFGRTLEDDCGMLGKGGRWVVWLMGRGGRWVCGAVGEMVWNGGRKEGERVEKW